MAEAIETPYPRRSYAWTVVGILFCTAVLSYTDRQVLSLLVDPVRAELHISDTQMSLLLGVAFAFIYGAAGIPLGWLADRTGIEAVYAVCAVLPAIGLIAAFLPNLKKSGG